MSAEEYDRRAAVRSEAEARIASTRRRSEAQNLILSSHVL